MERVRVSTTVLGVVPASVPENRVVARIGRATLRRLAIGLGVPFLPPAGVWRIERLDIP